MAAMAAAMTMAKWGFRGEYYRLVICGKFCNFCKCSTELCADFAVLVNLTPKSPLQIGEGALIPYFSTKVPI